MINFRNTNDKIHFYGSGALSLVLGLLVYFYTDANAILSYVIGYVCAFVLGLLWEAVEDIILPHWQDEDFWEGKPKWMHKHLSGDDWDWTDIKINAMGSTIILPLITLLRNKD